uniref:NADH dehydrogenase [ubiquinone] 1 beta subcomplex subunit 9 n=1 Tax=Oryctolagus cuniculus TaxID=9986 RepID=A0A5F9DSQ3_RABIT
MSKPPVSSLPTFLQNPCVTCLRTDNWDKYRYFACLLRARFDEHKNEKDMMKATRLLRDAEEEFWCNQHPQPYIFPDSPGGTSYERYECYKVPEWCLDYWHPSEKAMYPDYFAKREQWKKLRRESWEREVCPACPSPCTWSAQDRALVLWADTRIPGLAPCFSDILEFLIVSSLPPPAVLQMGYDVFPRLFASSPP